jgi:hypothetical protein
MKFLRIFRYWRWFLLAGVILFIGIQFVPIEITNPPVESEIDAEAEVLTLLRQACYDCHSNETFVPWYGKVAPVSWWLADHVEHGRGHLNFSRWAELDPTQEEHLLHEITEEVSAGEMPPGNYRWLHPLARLDDAQRLLLLDWANQRAQADREPPRLRPDP